MPADDVTIDFVLDGIFKKVMTRLYASDEPLSPAEAQNLYLTGAILTLSVVILGSE